MLKIWCFTGSMVYPNPNLRPINTIEFKCVAILWHSKDKENSFIWKLSFRCFVCYIFHFWLGFILSFSFLLYLCSIYLFLRFSDLCRVIYGNLHRAHWCSILRENLVLCSYYTWYDIWRWWGCEQNNWNQMSHTENILKELL